MTNEELRALAEDVIRLLDRVAELERLFLYVWSEAELPIAAVMRAQRARGDQMTVRDAFNWGDPSDPLVTDVDLLLARAALSQEATQEEGTDGRG